MLFSYALAATEAPAKSLMLVACAAIFFIPSPTLLSTAGSSLASFIIFPTCDAEVPSASVPNAGYTLLQSHSCLLGGSKALKVNINASVPRPTINIKLANGQPCNLKSAPSITTAAPKP